MVITHQIDFTINQMNLNPQFKNIKLPHSLLYHCTENGQINQVLSFYPVSARYSLLPIALLCIELIFPNIRCSYRLGKSLLFLFLLLVVPFFPLQLSLTSIVGRQSLQHLARTPTDLRLRVAQHVHEQVQGSCFPEDPGEGPDAGIGTEHVDGVEHSGCEA